jgi:hypothetical protein
VIAVRRLLAVTTRVRRRNARGDQVFGVASDRAQPAKLHERALTTVKVKAGTKALLCEGVQPLVDRFC